MKIPQEWLIEIESNIENAELNRQTIAEIQKEAYNQAIDDAAASVEIGYTYGHGSEYVNKESILKLKKNE